MAIDAKETQSGDIYNKRKNAGSSILYANARTLYGFRDVAV